MERESPSATYKMAIFISIILSKSPNLFLIESIFANKFLFNICLISLGNLEMFFEWLRRLEFCPLHFYNLCFSWDLLFDIFNII